MADEQIKEEEASAASPFLFNDYFTSEQDRGIEVSIPWGSKTIPVRIKHSLTIGEKQHANEAAFKIDIDKNGKPSISKQDQGAYTMEVVLTGLKYWPFEYAPGKPVPINRETLARIDGDLLDAIANRILGGTRVNVAALAPFEKKSGGA